MKKRARILLPIIILIIIIIIPFLSLRFTGYLVKEQEKQLQFYFYDELTNCPLNGYVFIEEKAVGKSNNGIFNLTYPNYISNFQNNQEISIFGKLGNCFENPDLFFDKSWIIPQIEKKHFLGETSFNFKTQINPTNPTKRELQGFIQPAKINSELNNINLKNKKTLKSLSEINKYLNNKIEYIKDWEFEKPINLWQTPEETLKKEQGDCEDFSTTLLSLFLAYNNSLNCYNLVFTTHITTFCHIEDYYIYYDQEKTELIKEIPNHNQKTKTQLEKLNKDYFEHYGLNKTKVHYAFNDKTFAEFETNDEFVNWQYNLEGIKTQSDIFLDIEKEIKSNIQNLPETNLETGELRTQTISLPNSKNILYFIIFITVILLIVLIIILVKK